MEEQPTALIVMPQEWRSRLLDQLSGIRANILIASSCSEAVELLRDTPAIRVVLTDLSLPDGSWLDVLNRVANLNPSAEVVVCARMADERLWTAVLEAGGFDVLVEPYQEGELKRVIEAAAASRRPARESFSQFNSLLEEAISRMDQIVQKYPDDPMLQSIKRQVRYVHEWTRNGRRPSKDQVRKLSFGVMASRAVDDIDRHLAQTLYSLANYLDRWVRAEETESLVLTESGKKAS